MKELEKLDAGLPYNFYDTYDDCVSFGRRDVNVYIIG